MCLSPSYSYIWTVCPPPSTLCRVLEVHHRNLVNEILLCPALLKVTDWELLSEDRPVFFFPSFSLSFFIFLFLPSFFLSLHHLWLFFATFDSCFSICHSSVSVSYWFTLSSLPVLLLKILTAYVEKLLELVSDAFALSKGRKKLELRIIQKWSLYTSASVIWHPPSTLALSPTLRFLHTSRVGPSL